MPDPQISQVKSDQGSREADLDALLGAHLTPAGWVASAEWWLDEIGEALPEASPMFKALVASVKLRRIDRAELEALRSGGPLGSLHEDKAEIRRLRAENETLGKTLVSLIWEINERRHQIERDRREPDKVLLGLGSIRRALFDAQTALPADDQEATP